MSNETKAVDPAAPRRLFHAPNRYALDLITTTEVPLSFVVYLEKTAGEFIKQLSISLSAEGALSFNVEPEASRSVIKPIELMSVFFLVMTQNAKINPLSGAESVGALVALEKCLDNFFAKTVAADEAPRSTRRIRAKAEVPVDEDA